jgi:O-antigen/teichoic acid export membrane protein
MLGLAGVGYELLTSGHKSGLLAPLATGLGTALICALVGSAVGTLFNPPLIRHPAAALLCTIGAIVLAWVARISPANAALRGNGALKHSAAWPAGLPLGAAVVLVAASWTASCWLAGRRGE